MPLTGGERLGPYEILELVGAGGMGEVYKARDQRLNRIVAVKVSKEQFSERFEREARAVAALNHPNICHLYDVGPNYLVMEFVEGEALAGPLPYDTAIKYALQIAEAIEAAHDKGIVHRDLKPSNIRVTPDGAIKVLDFGLAKALESETLTDGRMSENSPTLTIGATKAGTILGTAAYMSPEQAKGKSADRRADVWSFGVVLYEMITGRRLFRGETVGDVLASVIKEEPDLSALPAGVRALVARCLIKEPKQRLQAIGEARLALESPSAAGQAAVPSGKWLGRIGWIVAALASTGAAALAFIHFRETPPPVRAVRFEVTLPENLSAALFKISPNGEYLAVAGGGSHDIIVRTLESLEFRSLPGTKGARYPFWSPDSGTIGFFQDGKLKKVSVNGGPVQTLCEAADGRSGTWNTDGVIVFAPSATAPLQRVGMGGGVPVAITKLSIDGEDHRFPEFLPDQRHFLYTINGPNADANGIVVGSLQEAPAVHLLRDVSSAAYVPAVVASTPGYILFHRENTLMAVPFDPQKLQFTGEVFPVAEHVGISGNIAYAAFSASSNGVLAHNPGSAAAQRQLVWVDRTGNRIGTVGKPGAITFEALSPDDKSVAYLVREGIPLDVWLYDMTRDSASRFTFGPGEATTPIWSPDGTHIVYGSRTATVGTWDIFQKPASGGAEENLKKAAGVVMFLWSWSPDGKTLVYSPETTQSKTKTDLWLFPMEGDHKPSLYLQTPFTEYGAQYSPDGHWMAYTSDESGKRQVNVQPVPPTGAKWQISTAGGERARWRRDGKEIFYMSAERKLMAVPVKTSPTFQAGSPQELFETHINPTGQYEFYYTPSKDGQRFLLNVPAGESAAQPPITVVLNWQAGLKR